MPAGLKNAPVPPRSYVQRIELAESTSPRGPYCHPTEKASNVCSAPLRIFRVVLLLLQMRRGALCSSLGTTIKFLRRATSGVAGNQLGTTIKYLRRATSGAAGNGLGATVK
jgi:hypothetical protein